MSELVKRMFIAIIYIRREHRIQLLSALLQHVENVKKNLCKTLTSETL